MSDEQRITIHELPAYWQHQIRKMRTENRKLRQERNLFRDLLIDMRPDALEGTQCLPSPS